jgi:hydrogenase maturation protease
VLAIGSAYGADGIGWQLAEQLSERGITNVYSCRHPIDLLPYFQTYRHCIVIDAVWADHLADSQLIEIKPNELSAEYCPNSHSLTLYEVIQLAGISGQLPQRIQIIGINIAKRAGRTFNVSEINALTEHLMDQWVSTTTGFYLNP